MLYNFSSVFFSPTFSTKKVMDSILSEIFGSVQEFDLCIQSDVNVNFDKEDIVFFGVPAYSGRVPEIFIDRLKNIKGNNTRAVIIVTYGNRAYDDTLLELKNTVESNGFKVIAAGAFIAEHSLAHKIAADRPNDHDISVAKEFAKQITAKINSGNCQPINVKGNFPYRQIKPIPLKPYATKKCISCGLCARQCPVKAISENSLRFTDTNKCISCARCVKICPVRARRFNPLISSLAGFALGKKCQDIKEPELFI